MYDIFPTFFKMTLQIFQNVKRTLKRAVNKKNVTTSLHLWSVHLWSIHLWSVGCVSKVGGMDDDAATLEPEAGRSRRRRVYSGRCPPCETCLEPPEPATMTAG